MDREQLLAFVQIARLGSFSAAARALDLSQPTITARIQALEREVGGTLFVRGGRPLELTERGLAFLPYARHTLELLIEGLEAAYQTEVGQQGQIRLGVTESLTGGFLALVLARFYQTHPRVEFFFRTGHTDQLAEMLHEGRVKLGLLTWPYFDPDLTPLLLLREPLVLVAPPNHPLAQFAEVDLSMLGRLGRPFLLVRWSGDSMKLVSSLKLAPHETIEVPLETTRALLRQGLGVSLLTHALVANELAEGHLCEIKLTGIGPLYRESGLVRLANAHALSPVLNDFVAHLKQVAQSSGLLTNFLTNTSG